MFIYQKKADGDSSTDNFSILPIFSAILYLLRDPLSPSRSSISFAVFYLLRDLLYPSRSSISFAIFYLLRDLLSPSRSPISFAISYLLRDLLSPSRSPIFFTPLSSYMKIPSLRRRKRDFITARKTLWYMSVKTARFRIQAYLQYEIRAQLWSPN
jgi:hypothetical protein